MSFVAAVAILETLSEWISPELLGLKWPNDVLADERKLAGILLETSGNSLIVGIGVNLVSAPEIVGNNGIAAHSRA